MEEGLTDPPRRRDTGSILGVRCDLPSTPTQKIGRMGNIEMHKASMQLESRKVLNLITQHPHCSNIKVLQGKIQDKSEAAIRLYSCEL